MMPYNIDYDFNVEFITDGLIHWIKSWFANNGPGCNAVIGLSGGKDSTIIAALCAKALGTEHVIGVAMPHATTGQGLNDADKIAEYLGIKFKIVDISSACDGLQQSLGYGLDISTQTLQNIPPRVRMTTLYAIAQTENGRVACCDNASEAYIGYSTLFGDNVGSFAPLKNFTVTEVRAIGHQLGLPANWVEKIPDDGLPCSSPDEQKFGFSYEQLDFVIRNVGKKSYNYMIDHISADVYKRITEMNAKNAFKTKIVNIPGYEYM